MSKASKPAAKKAADKPANGGDAAAKPPAEKIEAGQAGAPAADGPKPQPSMRILGQYLKDLSFENPNAPHSLFPFARQILADATRNGGFPPLMLDPIDFAAMYQKRMLQQQQERATVKN